MGKGSAPRARPRTATAGRREEIVAVHATLRTRGGRPLFREPALAWAVFARVAGCGATLAARLDPDRLEWLLAGARPAAETLAAFRAFSERLARRLGHGGALWSAAAEHRPLTSVREVEVLAARLGGNGSGARPSEPGEPGEREAASPYRLSRLRGASRGGAVRRAARRGRRGRARSGRAAPR